MLLKFITWLLWITVVCLVMGLMFSPLLLREVIYRK